MGGEGERQTSLGAILLRSRISWQDYQGKVLSHRPEITFIPEIVHSIFVGIFWNKILIVPYSCETVLYS